MKKYEKVWKDMKKYEKVWKGMKKSERKSLQRYEKASKSLKKYEKVWKNMKNMQKHEKKSKLYKNFIQLIFSLIFYFFFHMLELLKNFLYKIGQRKLSIFTLLHRLSSVTIFSFNFSGFEE